MAQTLAEFKKEGVAAEEMPRFMELVSNKFEKKWVIFLSDGDIISKKSLEDALEVLRTRKDVEIVGIVKAPSKKGMMFR